MSRKIEFGLAVFQLLFERDYGIGRFLVVPDGRMVGGNIKGVLDPVG